MSKRIKGIVLSENKIPAFIYLPTCPSNLSCPLF